jgi:hypothetical protein
MNVIEKKLGLTGDLQPKMPVSNSRDFTHQLIIDKALVPIILRLFPPKITALVSPEAYTAISASLPIALLE